VTSSFLIADAPVGRKTATITAINDNLGLIQGAVAAGARTDDTTPTITGTLSSALSAGETLRIYNGTTLLGTATVNNTSRTWSYTPTLPASAGTTYNITARVAAAAGNLGPASAVRSFILDTSAPLTTTAITAVSDNVGLIQGGVAAGARTDDTTPTITGTLSSALGDGDILKLYNGTTFLTDAVVDNTALTWSATPTLRLDATYNITAQVVDAAGHQGPASASRTFILDTLIQPVQDPLKPANQRGGTTKPVSYADFAREFEIKAEDLKHLLKLANPEKYGKVFAEDVYGKLYEISGARAINSFGNNLSNAGTDGKYGTADDIKSDNINYKTNSQGLGAEFWGNADTPFSRLTKPEWGRVNGVEDMGRPRGYTGGIDINTNKKLVEPLNQDIANSRLVSNALGAQSGQMPNSDGANNAQMSFGQYFSHGLDFLERSGSGQSIASATASQDPLNRFGGSVGVVGDRGAQFVMDPVSRTLVQVGYFNAGPHGEAGLYSFTMSNALATPVKSAASILGRPVVDTDVLSRNKTESYIQNSQAYGSTNSHAYLLRESARFNAAGIYTDQDGVVYKIGGSVNGRQVSGVANGLVKLTDNTAPGGFQLVKTAMLLSSRLLSGDGLPQTPTYAEILLNNGVNPSLINSILSANAGNGVSLSSAEWVELTKDPRFVNAGNVLDFDPSSATYKQLSGSPLIGDTAKAINATAGSINNPTDPNFGTLAAIDQNLDGIPDALRNQAPAALAPFFPGMQISPSMLAAQPLIKAEDWGAGLLLFHTVAGDWRANENLGLSNFHNMWTREHNFQVENLKASAAHFGVTGISEVDLHNMARIIVEAQYQKIVYEEFAPSLAGDKVLDFGSGQHGFAGYNPNVDVSVSLEFAVASFRVGHSQIGKDLITGVDLFNGFLNPGLFYGYGASAIQAGLLQQAHEAIDTLMTDVLRNNLVTRNLDLFTANVLRGRELGLAGFNQMRRELFTNGPLLKANGTDTTARFMGNPLFKPYGSWEEFGRNLRDWKPATDTAGIARDFNQADPSSWGSSELLTKFRSVYANLEDVDAWVGMLAEKPTAETGQMGPLMAYVFHEQLDRLQEGDRYYYIPRLDGENSDLWNELSDLSVIMKRTSMAGFRADEDAFATQASNDILTAKPAFIASSLAVGDEFRTGVTNLFAAADPWANLVAPTI